MAQTGNRAASTLAGFLQADSGVAAGIAAVTLRENVELASIPAAQILAQNVAAELAERTPGVKYPVVYVYCERIENRLTEKFRRFSGIARLVTEVRASQDRLEGLEQRVQLYVEAVTEVLENKRGKWTDGVFYGGGYEVKFDAVRHGGKNYLQTAKVMIDVHVSVS